MFFKFYEFYGIIIRINIEKEKVIFMAGQKRFVKTYSQGTLSQCEIWVDMETGVNYIFRSNGYAGGLTPLLNRDGTPVVTAKYMLDNN